MITNCMAAIGDPRRHKHCQTLNAARTLDFAWMLCLSAGVHDTPMWVGWSANLSQYRIAELPMQKICYLPHINESPTSTAVVQETMKIAKQIAEECCQEYISITYDLAIAKITFPIQGEDPSYNNLFIQLGSFHILLSFFKGIGKLIADSRGPFVLTETGILAQDFDSVIEFRENCINPFSSDAQDLVIISTGKVASEETTRFLLNVMSNGEKMRDEFIQNCCNDPESFERPIPRQKLHTFASEDGQMNKTNKAKLFKILEDRVKHQPPTTIDVSNIDGFFFLHLCPDFQSSFGKSSRHILQCICLFRAKKIHLIFDRVTSPRTDSDRDVPIKIAGDNQLRHTDFIKTIRNNNFKRELVPLLVKSRTDDSLACFLGEKLLYVTEGQSCFSFQALNGQVLVKKEEGIRSIHEEADSRIIAHLNCISSTANVTIRTSDTDVLAIVIGNMSKIRDGVHTWLEVGTQSKNNHRYVDINAICKSLGKSLSNAIPAFHAFTGCDYTPAFSRKTKTRPFSILEKNLKFQEAFSSMGQNEIITDTIKIIEENVCSMYGKQNLKTVNECKMDMFLKIYQPKRNKNPMANVKGMPLCIIGSNQKKKCYLFCLAKRNCF
ncbi:hypothetical protein DAPPUDRAFT_108314 [Daphnia pulex]|uniref:Uncharacterized protein n=1 Tax=Daphnia pulex TaxID=6669 RepID=E9GZS8_DAPPU|nr:hypothetical protein DAPPUDRAFT_108314 [Daphnia pulex]|eukprot:EFX75053.1 hypothetical protein DAPPUDRAFT_108314 [Daphnia pulex]